MAGEAAERAFAAARTAVRGRGARTLCRGVMLLLAALALGVPQGQAAKKREALKQAPRPAVLQLTGQAEGNCPDILFFAPRLTEGPKAYRKILRTFSVAGTSLTNAPLSGDDFCSMGPLPVLQAAGYRIIPVQELAWREACVLLREMLELRWHSRTEDEVEQAPICVILSEEALPKDLEETLPLFLKGDALIFLALQDRELPLVVAWRNTIWPDHTASQEVHVDNWIPTLAEIVGLLPPAEVAAASVLPLLTGVGYQRPLNPPSTRSSPPSKPSTSTRASTMMYTFHKLPEVCPWVPDFTDSRTGFKPTERRFFASEIPLPAAAAELLPQSDQAQGLYLRSTQKALSFTLPAGVSCVVRVRGRPVLSVWEPKEPTPWAMEGPEAVPVELFLILPPELDPATLPLFLPKAEAEE